MRWDWLSSIAKLLIFGALVVVQQGLADTASPSAPYSPSIYSQSNTIAAPCAPWQSGVECGGLANASSTGQAFAFDSSALGYNSPIAVSLKYDQQLSWILGLDYSHSFNENNAFDLKLDGGPNEYRANLTFAHAFNPRSQIKLTYEYLAQRLPYSFQSGTVNAWDDQNALGVDYRHLLNIGILHSFDITGSYIQANSKQLNPVLFQENGLWNMDYRNIAGGTESNIGASVTLKPLRHISLTLGLGYSGLHYHTKYIGNADDNNVLAYNAALTDVISPKTKALGAIQNTSESTTYTIGAYHIFSHVEASMALSLVQGHAGLPDSHSILFTLSFPAPHSYDDDDNDDQLSSIADWVKTPAVYESRVLAVADEKVVQLSMTNSAIPTQTILVGTELAALNLQNYFNFNPAQFDKVEYTFSVSANNSAVAANSLNLLLVQENNYSANVMSTAPMPISALNPGQYQATVTATGFKNGIGVATSNNSFEINVVKNANLAPSFTNFSLPVSQVGANFSFNLSNVVNNPNGGGAYTITATGLPSWMTLENNVLSGKPNMPDPGHIITLKVSNPAGGETQVQKTLIVTAAHVPPDFNNFVLPVAQVGENYNFDLAHVVSNVNGGHYIITADNLPSWLTLENNTLSGIPLNSDPGRIVIFKVSNEFGGSQVQKTLVVNGTPLPTIPTFNVFTLPAAVVGNSYYFNLANEVNNPAGGHFTIKAMGLPVGMSVQGNILTGTPVQAEPNHMIIFTVSNASGQSQVQKTLAITANPNPIKPTFNDFTLPNASVGQSYLFDVGAAVNNPDGGAYTLTAQPLPSGLTFTGNKLSGIPTISGSYTLTFTVSDAAGETRIQKTLLINGGPTPSAPTFNNFTLPGAVVGQSYSFNLANEVSNPDGESYNITATDLPEGLSLQNNILSGTPTQAEENHIIIFTVSNAAGNNQVQKSLTITAQPLTDVPKWNEEFLNNKSTALVGVSYLADAIDMSQYVTDPTNPNAANDQYQVKSLPTWLVFDGAHSLNTTNNVPDISEIGKTYTVEFTVANQYGVSTPYSQNIAVVANPQLAPSWNSSTILPATLTINQSLTPIDLTSYVNDPYHPASNENNLSFKLDSSDPTWVTLQGNQLTINPTATGVFTIKWYVHSIASGTDVPYTQQITVNAEPITAPVWSSNFSLPNANVNGTYSVSLKNAVSDSDSNDKFTFEFSGQAPSWLTIDNNQQVLASNGNITNQDMGPVSVQLIAKSTISGKTSVVKTFNLQVWLLAPTPNILSNWNPPYKNNYGVTFVIKGLLPNHTYHMQMGSNSGLGYGPYGLPGDIETADAFEQFAQQHQNLMPFLNVFQTDSNGDISIFYTPNSSGSPSISQIMLY